MTENISKQVTEFAKQPADYYAAYVYLVHCTEYPEDLKKMVKTVSNYYEDEIVQPTDWEMTTTSTARQTLQLQLRTIFTNVRNSLDLPKSYSLAVEKNVVSETQMYLTGVVGPLALKEIESKPWYLKDPHIGQLRNPFADNDTLEAIWKYSANRAHGHLGRMALSELMLGYLEPVSV